LPLRIRWRAENRQGDTVRFTSDTPGVQEIGESREDNSINSVLRLSRNSDFSSVMCIVTNGDYPGLTQTEFQEMSSNEIEEFKKCINHLFFVCIPAATNPMDLTASTQSVVEEESSGVSIPIYAIVLLAVLPAVVLPILVVITIVIYRKCSRSKRRLSIRLVQFLAA
jgi:hypothetical protein